MSISEGGHSVSAPISTAQFITGLEPLSTASAPLNAQALAFEHILASIARVEARLEAEGRQPVSAPPRSRPDPDPPYDVTSGWRRGSMNQRPISTAAVSMTTQPPLGFAGPSTNRGPQRSASLEISPWAPPGYGGTHNRSSQPSAWDYPTYRQEGRHGGQQSAWDIPSGDRDVGQYSDPMRYDNQRYEKPRYEKMKPPRFNGSEAVNWISRVQYYFNHMGTPEEQRLHYVVMMFEGPASEWIFNYRDNNPNANWADFLEDVRRRFDPQCFQNFIGLIAKLCQTGSLAEYNATFETMLNRVRGVPEYILLPIYIEGLTQPVKNQVRLQHPSSVAAAMALAVECDSCNDRPSPAGGFQRRSGGRYEHRQIGQPQHSVQPAPQQQISRPSQQKFSEFSKLPVIRLSQAEKTERSRLGLCWWCPEKWVAGHNCRGRFLVYMGADGDSEDESEEEEIPQDTQIVTADISHIYALEGRQKEDAIEMVGSVGSMEVRILVDTGSSHDFLHPRVAERLALPLLRVRPFRVYVGNGESLLCSWVSKQTRIVIQKHVFLVDLHILPVHGPDIILGRAWLKSLRRVTNDFDTDKLEFVRNGEHIRLNLVPPIARNVSLRQFSTLLTLQGVGEVFELVHLPHQQPHDTAAADSPTFPKDIPEEILAVLESHSGVFGLPSGMPPKRIFDHKIHLLPQTKPVNVRPYRYPYFQKTEIERQVKEMLDSGIIRPSQSPFSSPVLLIRKKDGSFRFCIDYRALNAATVPDNFPIPTTDELFDELGSARFFSKLDLRSGYHQIRMCEGDVYKTAFRTHDGHFEFLVMPFGLTNAPSTFQAAMNALFRPVLRQFVIVFFDDILIYSPTLQAHVRHLNEVLSILAANQFFVKLSKCTFACTTVEYLGHIITDGHLKADSTKIEAMMSWPVPTTVKQLRGFLGLTGYYRRFVEHYASIAGPLTELLKKDAFVWSPTAEASFGALKAAMSSAPVLRLPDFSRTFYLETDASDFGIGAVLLQDGHPVAFFSKKLGPKRRVSSTYHKELYAIVEAVQKWRQYLLGREFVIRSDQKSLKELLQQIIQTPDQQFYVRKLMGYKFRIEYKTGVSNRVADALSRRDVEETQAQGERTAEQPLDGDPGEDARLLMAVSSPVPELLDILRGEVQTSADLIAIEAAWKVGSADPDVSMSGGLIYFKRRIYVSQESKVKELILQEYHASPTAGHPGVDRTFKRLATVFYWKGMRKDVKTFVNACYECQTTKYSTQKPAGLLQPLPIPSRVWEDVSMDFITGLPQSRGYTAILVAVDRLTKYAHFAPLPSTYNALKVASIFIDTVVKHHGFPKTLVSDRDPVFLNAVWEEMLRLSGTKLHFSTAYHPQSDGQTEVRNRGLEQYLRAFTADKPSKWANFLPWAELALNCFYHEGLGTSPFTALYGREPPSLMAAPPSAATPPDVAVLIRQRGELIVMLRKNLERAQQRMRASANKHRRDVEFEVGDRVLLKLQLYRQHSVARPLSIKLARRFYGPFEILERIGQVAYRLRLPEGSRVHNVFHVSLLKPFVESALSSTSALPPAFAHSRPVARPKRILDRRVVLSEGATVDEVLLEWDDDGGAAPTWEPVTMVQRRFPGLLLEDKEVFKGGGVDTVQPVQPSARLKETRPEQPMEELDFDTSGKVDKEPERTIGKDRPRRQRRPPDHLADFSTSRK